MVGLICHGKPVSGMGVCPFAIKPHVMEARVKSCVSYSTRQLLVALVARNGWWILARIQDMIKLSKGGKADDCK